MLYKNGYYKQHLAVLKARVDNARREFNEAFEMFVGTMYSSISSETKCREWENAYETTFKAYLLAVKEYRKYKAIGTEVIR